MNLARNKVDRGIFDQFVLVVDFLIRSQIKVDEKPKSIKFILQWRTVKQSNFNQHHFKRLFALKRNKPLDFLIMIPSMKEIGLLV